MFSELIELANIAYDLRAIDRKLLTDPGANIRPMLIALAERLESLVDRLEGEED